MFYAYLIALFITVIGGFVYDAYTHIDMTLCGKTIEQQDMLEF